MKDLQVVLYELRNKPHGIIPEYAIALANRLEKYLEVEDTVEDLFEESNEPSTDVVNGVARIDISGVIMKRLGVPKMLLDLFGIVDLDNVDAELMAARDNPEVKSILLAVNSPGGFISGVETTAQLIDDISKEKEIVVYSDVLNASAAYWLSSQASSIITSADAEVGSVGVYTTIQDWSKALDNEGIKIHLIKAGKWKAIGEPSQPLSDEQKQFLQDEINDTWALFKSYVTKKRDIDEECLQGQTFSGVKAVNNGFSDGIENSINNVLSILTEKTTAN